VDRVILANLSKARAVVACSDLFTPSAKVPQSLIKIYDVIENAGGSIVPSTTTASIGNNAGSRSFILTGNA